MIHKAIVLLLTLATVGMVAIWGFAFFAGPYTTDWDLTEDVWCILRLAPGRCEVSVTKFTPIPEWAELPNPFLEKWVAVSRNSYKRSGRIRQQWGLTPWRPSRPPPPGLGRYLLGSAGRPTFPTSSIWYQGCPSWFLLMFAGLLGTYPTVVFIRRPFRLARRRRNGWCLGCGYDLQGNVSGVCPECGAAT